LSADSYTNAHLHPGAHTDTVARLGLEGGIDVEWKDLLLEFVEAIKAAAPAVWGVFRLEAINVAISMSIWAIALLGGLLAIEFWPLRFWYHQLRGDGKHSDAGGAIVLMVIFAIVFGIAIVALSTSAIARFVNPDYYAVRLILDAAGIGN
jgi:hypothetical protein